MSIRLYNTLTRNKDEFTPLQDNEVRMYNCGPTVYDTQHIGNLRAFVMWDILRRTLEYNGYTVKQVVNITDVGHLVSDGDTGEDKMTKGLKKEGWDISLENMLKLGRKFEEIFKKDLNTLNIKPPSHFPRASEHIQEDINIIQALEEKGFTYKTSRGVYFDTSKDPHYGKLRPQQEELGDTHTRLNEDGEKRNQRDFALWKFNTDLGWDSPWGKGFPGWHIECSAMSERYLELPFDIHTGGIEHISVHHTNEIAQSENARETTMANYWLHNNHLQIEGEKISKSLGNTINLSEIQEKGYSPLALRYLLLGTHYRSEMNFTWESLDGASQALKRLRNQIHGDSSSGSIHKEYQEKFNTALSDDLNTPQALAVAWELVRDDSVSIQDRRATLLDFDRVLACDLGKSVEIPSDIQSLIEKRDGARENGDFDLADTLRIQIEEKGFEVHDSEEGTFVTPK